MIITELECTRSKQTAKDAVNLVEYGAKQNDAKNLTNYGAGKTKDTPASEGHSFFICANEIDSIEADLGDEATSIDWHDAITELQSSYKHNPTVKHPFRHFVISLAEGESLTDKQWRKVVREAMSHLGYDNARYIAFRHADTENSHVHITVSTQNLATNKVISNWFSIEKAQEKMREFEKEFGLQQLENSRDITDERLVSDAHKYEQHTIKIKMMMRRLVDNAIEEMGELVASDKEKQISRSLPLFKACLLRHGIEITLKENLSKGEFSGLIYKFKNYSIPAGKLRSGNKYTVGGLIKKGVLNEGSNLIANYNKALNSKMKSMLEGSDFMFSRAREEAERKSQKVKKEMKEWDKNEEAFLIFSARKRHAQAVQDAIDFWMYHGKKIKNKRMRPVLHAIYEIDKGIHKGSGDLTKFFELLITMLHELSKMNDWGLEITAAKKDSDIESLQDILDAEVYNEDKIVIVKTHEKQKAKELKERVKNLTR